MNKTAIIILLAMTLCLNLFASKLSRSDVGIFYFSGHDIQIDTHNYLIPVNAKVASESDVEFEGISRAGSGWENMK